MAETTIYFKRMRNGDLVEFVENTELFGGQIYSIRVNGQVKEVDHNQNYLQGVFNNKYNY